MAKKSMIDPVEKIKTVEKILTGEWSNKTASQMMSVADRSIYRWKDIYLSWGPTALLDQKERRIYPDELKLSAVNAYLSEKRSPSYICKKYGIRSQTSLRNWIRVYNTHGEIKSRRNGGGIYMGKARQTTQEERLQIVKECLLNDKNYGSIAKKYNCSYHQVRNWVLSYEKMGSAGLEDRRGKRVGSLPPRTPEEELRDKLAKQDRQIRDLQMELDLLKKVRELELKDRYL